jgi:acyl dehydratase
MTTAIALCALAGVDLGEHVISYSDRDAILYALGTGARASQLELVFERDLRVLPTIANGLALWAVEAAGELGAYDRKQSLHASQSLRVLRPLPPAGEVTMHGEVVAAWDKGSAAMVDIEVSSEWFVARYGIFLPGRGGWGGERGPSSHRRELSPTWSARYATCPEQAALYRLTGDRHPIHIEPAVATANGFDRPILHGLCTLGIAAREVAAAISAHPADLRRVEARLAAPVMPGDEIEVTAELLGPDTVAFEARVGTKVVVASAQAQFRLRHQSP